MSTSAPARHSPTRGDHVTPWPPPPMSWRTRLLWLAGPVLLTVGYAFHPDLPAGTAAALAEVEGQRDTHLAAKLLVALGSLLFVPLVLLVRRRAVPGRGRGLATAAALLCTTGFVLNAVSQVLWGYLLWFATAPAVPRAAGTAVVEASQEAPLLPMLPVSFFSVPLFALGILILAAALWRAGTVPLWVPVALVLLDVVSAAFPTGVMTLVTLPPVVAFAVALNPTHGASVRGTLGTWAGTPAR